MLPVETIEAIFPSSDNVGKLIFHPMTLAHSAVLEMIGINFAEGINADNILLCGWVLSCTAKEVRTIASARDKQTLFKSWCEKTNPDLYEIGPAVMTQITTAFSTYVPPLDESGSQNVFSAEKGFGWILEIAECLCHEYGIGFEEALDTPLSRAYALMSVARVRNGGKNGGPDYYGRIQEREASAQFKKLKAERVAKEAGNGNQ